MWWVEVVAWAVVAVLAVPLTVFAVECFAALWPRRPGGTSDSAPRPRCAVLIPAHNEELVIANTLGAVCTQLAPGDRVLVVADNCTDSTAAAVRSLGVEVIERSDPLRRGKGYALAFGRESLVENPPDVVVVLDADCALGEGALHRLAVEAGVRNRPVQACYLMTAPPEAGPSRQVAAFAFLVKNWVRPLGLRNLGFGCLLTGTGMAFPWALFRSAPLGDGHIVEDMGLSVDLAANGTHPLFLPDAVVRSEFPIDESAADSQRRRWEHGHLRVITGSLPRLFVAALCRLRPGLVVTALDIAVPPLSALALVTGAVLVALGVTAALGGPIAPAVAFGSIALTTTAGLATVWLRYGRRVLPFRSLLRVPVYALKKVPLYLGFLIKPQSVWVRTARERPTRPAANDDPKSG